tara:strand:- start:1355 stop:1564 length:210 start_codon:yes stop_codon:yes gene_type:complete
MTELAEIGNLIVVIAGALGSLLLIVFKSRCKSICFGCIERDIIQDEEEAPIIGGASGAAAAPVIPPNLS